jgi:hypothetical protein
MDRKVIQLCVSPEREGRVMDRKVIQLCVSPEFEGEVGDVLYALCDDGTVWSLWLGADKPEWSRVNSIPQEGDIDD